MNVNDSSRLDVVIFGATSFVGRILCSYYLQHYAVNDKLRWGLAGRSRERLEALRRDLGDAAASLPVFVTDAADDEGLRAMCARTRVVISTVGPYAMHGEPLVKACAETGTDYCDITGEIQWVRKMIDRYEGVAKTTGARIVHCCGFDSVPSDLGVFFLQREAIRRFGKPCRRVKMRVRSIRGGASGGTVASMLNLVKEATRSPALRQELANPYSLCAPDASSGPPQPQVTRAAWDEDFGAWCGPFVMAAINPRIVHRSNALQARAYGADFCYDEAMLAGAGAKGRLAAMGISAGVWGLIAVAALPPTRWLLGRLGPAQGAGPSEKDQKEGFFDIRFFGATSDGRSLRGKVAADRDPGYSSTARMLGEAGICLARDLANTARVGGFWTPAAALGKELLDRLTSNAVMSFEVEESRGTRHA